jgi:RHS repeat-associated protein
VTNNYYAFGSLQPNRHFSDADGYRYGFNGQEMDNEVNGSASSSYTAEYWQYDSRLGRRWNQDPVAKEHESPYATFANNPINFIDPLGSDTAVFGGDNKFIKINPGGENVGMKLGKDGFVFEFADPVNDIKAIRDKTIKSLYIVSKDEVLNELERSGVNEDENRGFFDGVSYLKNHSNSGFGEGFNELDFTISSAIHGKRDLMGEEVGFGHFGHLLYITKVNDKHIAHNAFNFGNFMWGASAKALGLGLIESLSYAQVNNILNDPGNINRPWYDKKGDSKDDQRSITFGYLYRSLLPNAK